MKTSRKMQKRLILIFVTSVCFFQVYGKSMPKPEKIALETIPTVPEMVPGEQSSATIVVPPVINDGHTDNGPIIQKAIDGCPAAGGIIVLNCGGTIVSSPVSLKSNVYLKIGEGTILQAIARSHYPDYEGIPPHFISATAAQNTGITGGGTIDGNGKDWWDAYYKTSAPDKRPKLIFFANCDHVVVSDITVQNAPKFNIQPDQCTFVVFRNITIRNPSDSPNTDGIDPSSSDTVYIDHCAISTGDDNIAIKSAHGPCKNIYITNCTFGTGHGLSIGSETNTGVDHMLVQNCTFTGGDNGIRIKTPRKRGGLVQNIQFSNITMSAIRKYPLEISAYYPESSIPAAGTADEQPFAAGKTPQIQNILLENVTIALSNNRGGIIIGLPESPLSNIQLAHVTYESNHPVIIRNAHVYAYSGSNGGTTFTPECVLQEHTVFKP
jgi:polygalacturonase